LHSLFTSKSVMVSLAMQTSLAQSPIPFIPGPISDHALKALRISEGRYRRLFECARDGILLLNSDTGQIEDVNPYLVEMLGYSHTEFLGKKLWEVGAFEDIAHSREMFSALQTKGYVRYEDLPLRTVTGAEIAVEFVSNAYDCEGIKVIQCSIRDITERKKLEEALHHLAFHDPLTQLPNRRLLLDRLTQAMQTSKRQKHYMAVLCLDLNGFKELNDAHGHDVGDQLLMAVAHRLRQVVRDSDSVARRGTDEFVVVLEDLGEATGQAEDYAASIAKKIRRALSSEYTFGDIRYRGSCCVGVKVFSGDGDPVQILKEADMAMHADQRSPAA
jgi:diguanylate cyclase (GGDEF)-like protein/PAS domain S-box-containing protein